MLEGKPYKQNVSDRLRQRLGVKVSLFFFTTLRVVSYFCRDALGQYQRAIEYYQQSLDIARETGECFVPANAWYNSAISLEKLGRKSEALTAYQNARELYQEMGLDGSVKLCDNAIEALARVSLLSTVVRALLRWVHWLWRRVHAFFR